MSKKMDQQMQNIFKETKYKDGYLHDIKHKLKILEELERKNFTTIKGNNNVFDLIKYVDISEYSIMYCSSCKKLVHVIIEGCEGGIFFICEDCDNVIIEAFRHS